MNRRRAITLGGALLVALVLGVFAYVILNAQSQDREDVEQRFRDVAQVSAAVMTGIFQIAVADSAQQAARLDERRIDPRALEELAARDEAVYLEVLDADLERIAATPGAPAGRPSAAPNIALETDGPRFSNVVGEGADSVVELAVPYATPYGQRIYVSARPTSRFAEFLGGFLGTIPNFAEAESVMIDNDGIVLGGSSLSSGVGEPLEDEELRAAALAEVADDYGAGRYFASAPISGSPFQVVLDADKDDLYDSIPGSRSTIAWILFAAFALAAAVGLYLLRRAVLVSGELQRRQLNERHAIEINDNIIQGLALAKYQLEAGEGKASAVQVANTLREAQRLVSGLLGEAEVQAGQLRRDLPAETKRQEPPT